MPEASASAPEISGSLPEVSGDVSVPAVGGGLDGIVAEPSIDVDASLPSPSGDLPGERKSLGFEYFSRLVLLCVAYWASRGICDARVLNLCCICFTDADQCSVLAPEQV